MMYNRRLCLFHTVCVGLNRSRNEMELPVAQIENQRLLVCPETMLLNAQQRSLMRSGFPKEMLPARFGLFIKPCSFSVQTVEAGDVISVFPRTCRAAEITSVIRAPMVAGAGSPAPQPAKTV